MAMKKNTLNYITIIISVVALVVSIIALGKVLGVQRQPGNVNSAQTVVENQGPHYSCAKCNYSFDDLRSLRMEEGGTNHFYYCPSCGELLTSDVRGNAIDSMFDEELSYYNGKTIDNWKQGE